ncbi:MAG: FG-GAP-like repeat-containing protein [Paludisphaera borealis]|uniref:FG-GAP-like repeat-containing protein n=1 Tax=Paludisphaera borealis TaxID=1387353 RepID=UPI00284047CA|nr:FG-GAP-like repeat-containing protein [Paludisphaera borealis]MDR3618779.1 FG-GAP-like repeat-containing protein [Paludisphaera borealis]
MSSNAHSRRNRRLALGAALAVTAIIAAAAWYEIEESRRARAVEDARAALSRGHYGTARATFAWLASRRRDDGEALYQLGVCEAALGRQAEAGAAWDRVPGESPFAGRAAVMRARQELHHRRFATAEALMERALNEEGPHAIEAAETLVNLFKIQGRFREARRLVRAAWRRYPDRIGLLREMALLDSQNPFPIVRAREALALAAKSAPDDDRVALGTANLAIRTGDFAAAGRRLKSCLAKRPRDPAVDRARLDLALAIHDPDAARQVLARLPGAALDADEVLSLRAWFARRSGDRPSERRALTELLLITPTDSRALERLTELAVEEGDPAEASRIRARKGDFDRNGTEYGELIFLPDAASRVAQLAGLAERLERNLEARILWGLALERSSDDREAKAGLARAEAVAAPRPPPSSSLLALLADLDRAPPSVATKTASDGREAGHGVWFRDDAEASGLRFTFDSGAEPFHQLPEITSGGVGLLDYDGDGRLDVYLVQGGKFPPVPDAPAGDRLFRNRGGGSFEDVSERSGVAALAKGYGHGVTVGDYDGDGRPDLFLTRWRAYALFRNRGDGTFEDQTEAAGLGGDRGYPTSAAFADFDGDGDLDLYVCHYGVWDAEHPLLCPDPKHPGGYYSCDPRLVPPEADHLFRNDAGRFHDATRESGVTDPDGRGLGVVAADLDADGWVDLFVANDTTANYLFRNLGGMRFEEIGQSAGVASNANGGYQASMGVACGDLDGDGRIDLAVTNYYNESMTFYRSLGQSLFADHTAAVGLDVPTRMVLGFGTVFFDADDDGRLDLAATNGHVHDLRPDVPFAMSSQLFLGGPEGRLTDVSKTSGDPWTTLRVGRSMAAGDLDGDGRVDLIIVAHDQPVAYFHNQSKAGRSISLALVGGAGSNRDAVGARVVVEAGGRRLYAQRISGGGFQSASDPRLHFGLGRAESADRVEIRWPSGRVDRIEDLRADADYVVHEGRGRAEPAPAAREP